jgi:hypothetical protein
MLTNTLSTNEIKNSAGSEIEFTRLSIADRSTVFAQIGESPALPHRLTISHQESGSGIAKRRRSVVRVDKTVVSTVDSVTPVVVSGYIVLDHPVGGLAAATEPTHVLAELLSFCASLGASTTILYDGTGNGAQALLTGGI